MSRPARGSVRRHELLLAAIAALVVFIVPMTVVGWLDNPAPEVRVLAGPKRLSALVIDGDARMLILNTADREATVALLGRIAQPWEAKPTTLVAPASDDAAIGLWEALQRLEPAVVIVAGIPGADPLWAAIDAECAGRGIDMRYIPDRALLEVGRLDLTIFGTPPEQAGAAGVVIRRGDVNVSVAFDAIPPPVEAQALLMIGDPAPAGPDLLVTSDDSPRLPAQHEVIVGDLRYVRLVIEVDAVRVYGGVLLSPQPR